MLRVRAVRILFQVLDYANEWVAIALFDKALRVQTHDRPADRVAFVAANATVGLARRDLHIQLERSKLKGSWMYQ